MGSDSISIVSNLSIKQLIDDIAKISVTYLSGSKSPNTHHFLEHFNTEMLKI